MRPTPQVLLGESVVASGGAGFFQTLETFKEHTLAYAFGAVATAVVDDLLALRPIDSFPPQNRVPVFVLGAPSPLFQQPRIAMAMPAPSGQGSVQLRYLNNVPVTSFEVTRLTFLVPIAMQLLVLLPVSACSSLSTITSSNGNGNTTYVSYNYQSIRCTQ